jgi:hypothetical protein
MGMFKRIAKESERASEARSRTQEFEKAVAVMMDGFQASRDPENQYFEKASSPSYLENLILASERKRDEATRLNLHGFAAIFSSIHCRTFFNLHQDEFFGDVPPKVNLTYYGCTELGSLHSDIRYLAWGVNKSNVNPLEYWDCKKMVDFYEAKVIDYAKSQLVGGSIQVAYPRKEMISWANFERSLRPPTNVITPSVPPVN